MAPCKLLKLLLLLLLLLIIQTLSQDRRKSESVRFCEVRIFCVRAMKYWAKMFSNLSVIRQRRQSIFQDLEHGVSTNPWGSLPFSSPFPFSLHPLPLSPSFPPEAGRVLCESWGGITPPEGVWETPCLSTHDISLSTC